MSATPVKVLYIAGKGRSGSTILDCVLGQMKGFFSTGELWHLWSWGLERGARCGCGSRTPECPVWSEVLKRSSLADLDPGEAHRLQSKVLSWPRLPRMLAQRRDRLGWPALRRYARVAEDLYRSIAETTGAQVIVDSSKWPGHPGMLGLLPGVDSYVVHLVRDPRAVAYSYRRQKTFLDADDPTAMPRFSPVHSGASWLARNTAMEVVALRRRRQRWLMLRYEDFAADPRGTVQAVASLVGEPFDPRPFVSESSLTLEATHAVGGNPSKFTSGETTIRLDDQWMGAVSPWTRRLTTAVTAPLLPRYGYPLRPRPSTA